MSLKKARAGPLGTIPPSEADESRVKVIELVQACG